MNKIHNRLSIVVLRGLLKTKLECMECGSKTIIDHIHLHHKNMDATDDRLKNIQLVCRKCHKNLHRKNGPVRIKKYEVKKNRPRKQSRAEKFEKKYAHMGGIDTFTRLYQDNKISTADIGIKYNITREYVRQLAIILGLQTRGKGFMKGIYDRKNHVFRHVPINNWMRDNNLTARDLSNMLGVKLPSIYLYLNEPLRVPLGKAKELCILSNGKLTIEQIMLGLQNTPQPVAGAAASEG